MKFRKRPIVIEAFQMTQDNRVNYMDWPYWLRAAWSVKRGEEGSLQPSDSFRSDATVELEIVTKEGIHRVSWGDWIIQGIQGELYPCKPDIFESTYEAVV